MRFGANAARGRVGAVRGLLGGRGCSQGTRAIAITVDTGGVQHYNGIYNKQETAINGRDW